jgi:hypothetical protein
MKTLKSQLAFVTAALLFGCDRLPVGVPAPTKAEAPAVPAIEDMVSTDFIQRAIRATFPGHDEALAVHEDLRVSVLKTERVDLGTYTSKGAAAAGKPGRPAQLFSFLALYPLQHTKLCGLVAVTPNADLPDVYTVSIGGKSMSANDEERCDPMSEIPWRGANDWWFVLNKSFARGIQSKGWDFPILRNRAAPSEVDKVAVAKTEHGKAEKARSPHRKAPPQVASDDASDKGEPEDVQ